MKHIIIEGGDRLGKDTIIDFLCKHYGYNNIAIRHFNKPPKKLPPKAAQEFQFNTLYKEINYVKFLSDVIDSDEFKYFENILIWNRGHLGEYVYSQMYRGISKRDVSLKLKKLEQNLNNSNTYLITLIADPEFFLKKEDGKSLSVNIEQKTEEIRLFREIYNKSLIPNKLLIKVDNQGKFISKYKIFSKVLDFLNEK